MWIIANAFQKEGGISPRINQDSVKGAAVQKKKKKKNVSRKRIRSNSHVVSTGEV